MWTGGSGVVPLSQAFRVIIPGISLRGRERKTGSRVYIYIYAKSWTACSFISLQHNNDDIIIHDDTTMMEGGRLPHEARAMRVYRLVGLSRRKLGG